MINVSISSSGRVFPQRGSIFFSNSKTSRIFEFGKGNLHIPNSSLQNTAKFLWRFRYIFGTFENILIFSPRNFDKYFEGSLFGYVFQQHQLLVIQEIFFSEFQNFYKEGFEFGKENFQISTGTFENISKFLQEILTYFEGSLFRIRFPTAPASSHPGNFLL